jgi:FixJ family two-component response regulator
MTAPSLAASSLAAAAAAKRRRCGCPGDSWVAVVDDESSVRSALARLLCSEGIPVETFASAREFLERMADDRPRCAVLDVQLGGMTGFELQDELTSMGYDLPIIFITAHDEVSSVELARRAGSFGYLRKPFDCDALLEMLRRARAS